MEHWRQRHRDGSTGTSCPGSACSETGETRATRKTCTARAARKAGGRLVTVQLC
jgi:hypothetical protein